MVKLRGIEVGVKYRGAKRQRKEVFENEESEVSDSGSDEGDASEARFQDAVELEYEDRAQEDEEESEESDEEDPLLVLRRQDQSFLSKLDAAGQSQVQTRSRHAKNQQILWAEFLGLRIRMQPLVEQASRLDGVDERGREKPHPLAQMCSSLMQVQEKLVLGEEGEETGGEGDGDISIDALWTRISSMSQSLLSKHETLLNKLEKRILLESGSKLASINRGVFAQVDAVLAKRSNFLDSFDEEEGKFYQAMLKEFLLTKKAPKDVVSRSRKKLKRSKKKGVDVKASKGRRIRFDLHDKLVNFMPPLGPPPSSQLDLQSFFRSIFRS